MVAVSFFLVLALVSSTAVAQSATDGFTSLFAYFKRQETLEPPELPTESVYEWIPPIESALAPTSDRNSVKIGLSYILQKLNLKSDQFEMSTSFTDHLEVTHVYGTPLYLGFPIGNLRAAAHVEKGQTFFYSATIMNDRKLKKRSLTTPKPTVKKSAEEAVKAAVDCLKVPFYHKIAPVMEGYWTKDGNILVWVFQMRNDPITQWFEVKVNANTGVIVSIEDFKRSFTYTAIELPNKSPNDGFKTILNPENIQASPKGWTKGYKTIGNNAWVSDEEDVPFKTTTKGMFSGVFDPMLPPQTPKNIAMSAINVFYVTNAFHDTTYRYGFTEKAGNFQKDNFGKGGMGRDPVIINVQNSKKTNNAHFYTPPDGEPGVLDLYIYTATKPHRDPALDNTVMIHELTHGLTGRLTGGAHDNLCMSVTESRGLSEGYSDMMALMLTAKAEDTRDTKRVIGEYVKGNSRGMRMYPYTTDMKVNPLTYKDVVGEKDPHRLGTIWAIMLLEVYWNFVRKYGFSANLNDATQKKGNTMFLQLFVGTLMIQPCNPTFESAYNAMLAADYAYYGGIHKDLINEGFAKRGLGSIS
ncbi:hypothetical protein BASA50_011032 [Batrachochytrium salamandrivorans]|uniref:Extracellular metalloproteinase n=1 Tax=Batrachochytrium salamandrivorans TaxID=1357716 RepID=A0ABQ8EZZ3_9FUNG|nr:hypothetical protein BASA50_011032 [Batrachochytrium salamandrivorans]